MLINIAVSKETHPELYRKGLERLGLELNGGDTVTVDTDSKIICHYPICSDSQIAQLAAEDAIWNAIHTNKKK